jgi:hypothetical protein
MRCRLSVALLAAPPRWRCLGLGFCRSRRRSYRSKVARWVRTAVVGTNTTKIGVSYCDVRRICGIRRIPVTSERNAVGNEVGGAPTVGEPWHRPLFVHRDTCQDTNYTAQNPCSIGRLRFPKALADMPRWWSRQEVVKMKEVFSYHAGEATYAEQLERYC